jgi:hypothetical protein
MLSTLYVDASFKDGNAGGGAWIRSNKGVLTWAAKYKANTPHEAEAYAILAASQFVYRNWPETKVLYIVSDSKVCVEYLWPHTTIKLKSGRLKEYLDDLITFAKKNKIRLRTRWIKGHQTVDSPGKWANNKADKLAKTHR